MKFDGLVNYEEITFQSQFFYHFQINLDTMSRQEEGKHKNFSFSQREREKKKCCQSKVILKRYSVDLEGKEKMSLKKLSG